MARHPMRSPPSIATFLVSSALALIGCGPPAAQQPGATAVSDQGVLLVPRTVVWTAAPTFDEILISDRADFLASLASTCGGGTLNLPDGHYVLLWADTEPCSLFGDTCGGSSGEFVTIVEGNVATDDWNTSGTVTLSSAVDGGLATGSYDLVLTSTARLSGSFTAGWVDSLGGGLAVQFTAIDGGTWVSPLPPDGGIRVGSKTFCGTTATCANGASYRATCTESSPDAGADAGWSCACVSLGVTSTCQLPTGELCNSTGCCPTGFGPT